ncbi:MAG: zf-HC2 domain-containing protein [Acidobacteriaceae bacterium]|nr:zf-HC2 domain-containing protein [Acidobacteriaceae bacterium]
MSRLGHLDMDLLVRAIDDELSAGERMEVESHLGGCDACRARYRELAALSVRLEQLVRKPYGSVGFAEKRAQLDARLVEQEGAFGYKRKRQQAAQRLRWAVVIAASVILGLAVLPLANHGSRRIPVTAANYESPAVGTFEVSGETFVVLPYSNSDLPMDAPHIVEMQVPVSSLTEAGLVVEPVSAQAANPNGSVLADVLLGEDGEPLGVHVITNE